MCTSRCAPIYPYKLQHARVKCQNDMVFWSNSGTSQGISNSTAQGVRDQKKKKFFESSEERFLQELYLFSLWLFSVPISSHQIPFPQMCPYTTLYFTNICKSTKKPLNFLKIFLTGMPSLGSTQFYIVYVPMKGQAGKSAQ